MKQFLLGCSFLLGALCGISAAPLPKHWHETKGFGTNIKGGIAGEVYKVTNLKSGGAGSLSDAVSKGNRLVVFEVGGVVEGGIKIASNVTVAGQTAPYPGITMIKGNMTATGSNIVVSHITVQLGTAVSGHPDAGNVAGSGIVLDHVAVYWGKDETLSLRGCSDVTLYKCIVGEGLQFTGHGDGEHSKGLHIQSGNKDLSVIGCLSPNSAIRNPRVDRSTAFLANHVVYNWGTAWDHVGPQPSSDKDLPNCEQCLNKVISGHTSQVTLVGSVALQGPESVAEFFYDGHSTNTTGYLKDNIIKDQEGNDLKQANTEGVYTGGRNSKVTLLEKPPIWPEGMEPLPAEEALYEVLRTVGPHPGNRNAQNARIARNVADNTGKIIDSEDEVGGYPNYKETKRSLTVPDGAEARQAWLDSLEDEIAVDKEIDLSRLYTMVGSIDSDKLRSPSFVDREINPVDGFGIKIIQRNSTSKQLYVSFKLSAAASMSLKIFDLAGNKVIQKTRKLYKAGPNEMAINADHLPAGLYLCRFKTGNTLMNHKIVIKS